MTTKQEFLDLLAARYRVVGSPALQREVGGVKIYTVEVLDLPAADSLTRLNIGFMVEDEGGPAEAAYWTDRDPETSPPKATFIADVETYIAGKIVAGVIEAAFLDTVDLANEKATAYAYVDVAGSLQEKKALLRRDGLGAIEHVILSTVL